MPLSQTLAFSEASSQAPKGPNAEGFCIPGQGQPLDSCGRVRAVVYCPTCDETKKLLYDHCDRAECPTCRTKWLSRATIESAERLFQGSKLAHKPLHHVVFSPDDHDDLTLKELRTRLHYRLRKAGVTGAMIIFHPFRFRSVQENQIVAWKHCSLNLDAESPVVDCYAEYSPHFHLICSGYLMQSDKFHEKYGWIYKKLHYKKPLRSLQEIKNTIWYCLSHSGVHEHYHGYTYFGQYSNNNMLIGKEVVEYHEVVCDKCEAPLFVHRMPQVEVNRKWFSGDHNWDYQYYEKIVHRKWEFRNQQSQEFGNGKNTT